MLVHYPIGLLITGTLIELFSFLGWRTHSFRSGGRWMILIGALAAVPTATSGIYALYDAARVGTRDADSEGSWRQLAAVSPVVNDAPAWAMLVRHTWLEAVATALLLFTVTAWIGSSDRIRARLHPLFMLLLLGGIGLTGTGAYFSGEGVYRYGVGVRHRVPAAEPPKRLEPTSQVTSAPTTESGGQTAEHDSQSLQVKVEYFAPPLQLHVISAGMAVALAVLSLGLAMRAMTATEPEAIDEMAGIAAALGGNARDETRPPAESRSVRPVFDSVDDLAPRIPSARFWLLASLAGLLTLAGGWWVLASSAGASLLAFKDLWQLIRDQSQNPDGNGFTRRFAHVVCGAAIVVLPILLAITARWAPRGRFLLGFLTLLLTAAIAGQVWLGVLLVYDSNAGPVMRFNVDAVSAGK